MFRKIQIPVETCTRINIGTSESEKKDFELGKNILQDSTEIPSEQSQYDSSDVQSDDTSLASSTIILDG